jgi:hypothetical protein
MPHSLCQRIVWNLLFLLLTGAQMADEDYDQRGRAGLSEFFNSRTRRAGE